MSSKWAAHYDPAIARPPVGLSISKPGATAAMSSVSTADKRGYYAEILLVSFAALLIEISYTRVISFKFFYYYTYLVIGLALLGIGCGGVVVAISKRLRRASLDSIMLWGLLLGAASVGVGYLIIAAISIDTLLIWDYGTRASLTNLARLVVICLTLFASFVSIGVMIATLFARKSERIGRLYFADLLGAGLACAVVVFLIATIGPPAAIMLAGLVLALTGLRIAWRLRSRLALGVGAVLAVALAVTVVAPDVLPEQGVDAIKSELTAAERLDSRWSAIFRVDTVQLNDDSILLYHDGLPGSAIHRWDGDPGSLTRFDHDPRSFPFSVAGDDVGNVMIIGAAGGNEILTSLYYDAERIDAIELNPVTHDLVTDEYADFAGDIADQPGVNYVNGDGRSFLARSDDQYDLIWYPAPDSYAASNAATAGAFVLSESYLYTSDTVQESLEHLGEDGILATQYGEFRYEERPNRTSRYVATARDALEEMGVDDPSAHIMVATSPAEAFGNTLSTILVKATPFTDAEVDRFVTAMGDVEEAELQYAPEHEGDNPVTTLATAPDDELDEFYESYPFDVTPISDDGPFFWHFTPFRDVIRDFSDPIDRSDFEIDIGERVLLLLLGVGILMAAGFLLLPFLTIRDTWKRLPRKGRSAIYFGALGLGFLFFEITLIQRLILFLGYPTYSLTVTLASLLIFTGVGAFLSGRYEHQRDRVIPVLLGAITVLTLVYAFALPPLTDALLDTPLGVRVLVAFVVLAPLGVCLGTFMPVGLGAVAALTDHSDEYVAWGWAVNGFFSVIGAVLTTILAMILGFQTVLFVALGVYVIALMALRGLLAPSTRSTSPPPG